MISLCQLFFSPKNADLAKQYSITFDEKKRNKYLKKKNCFKDTHCGLVRSTLKSVENIGNRNLHLQRYPAGYFKLKNKRPQIGKHILKYFLYFFFQNVAVVNFARSVNLIFTCYIYFFLMYNESVFVKIPETFTRSQE